ncbi:MAG: arsenate reductase (glutaredoxin) [Thiogranum sp.]|nr:arsenate reductase (glutaredoxin) [Thiogranum sp.]
MSKVTLYYNPRCSKSRQTLELLQARGIEPHIVEYLESPPDAAQLDELLKLLQLQPRDLIRNEEAEYAELGLDDPALTCEQLIQAMVGHPRLIQRPIVVHGDRAALGRPPERILEIL